MSNVLKKRQVNIILFQIIGLIILVAIHAWNFGLNNDVGVESVNCLVIGDNVEFGYNCGVFGNVRIASNVAIGAGCIVVKDILKEGSKWAGVPAKEIGTQV